jgi:hypothetical protein
MRSNSIHISALLLTIALVGCEKAEKPIILPPIPEGVQLVQAPLGKDYDQMVFVNLQTGMQYFGNINAYDFKFESQANQRMVMMNGGREVLVASTGKLEFGLVDLQNLSWDWDRSSATYDSLRLMPTMKFNNDYDTVFVVDRGIRLPNERRYYQIKFISTGEREYLIEVADVNGNNSRKITIPKDPNREFVYFDYENGYLNFEPNRNDWHICFKRHRTVYYEYTPPLLYTVVGTYINRHKVDVGVDSSFTFNDINHEHAKLVQFHNKIDFIGFEWKWPNFTATGVVYSCRTNWNYFIRDRQTNHLFKLRFIDFYNDNGIKGYPRFELKQLQ